MAPEPQNLHRLAPFTGRRLEVLNCFVERQQSAEAELGRRARLPAVAVDHLARPVPGPVRHPRLGAAVGEGERRERGSEVVHAELPAVLAVVVQLAPIHTSGGQVLAQQLGQPMVARQGVPVLVGEHEVLGLGVAPIHPSFERARRAGVERPRPRVVGLVLVEAHGPRL